ncbi:putative claudin-24 [Trichomycterus rosablanca]|uniref:putative claudin-24 n=1 Tax=Trichomycterus rosablanca TaxID=2290929 RepID=UPI002F35BAFF
MSNPCTSVLEMLGMMVGASAWFCSLAATLMPQWLTLSTELLAVESYESGLWETCVVQDVAGTECRPFDSLLGLPYNLTLARILMCISDALGVLSLLIAVPGLKVVKSCGGSYGRRVKRGIKITAAVLIFTAGVLVLAPVSMVAHETVLRFFDESLPHTVPRWEFGDALFVGWSAGFLYVVAALLFFTSCLGLEQNELQLVYHHHHPHQENFKPHSSINSLDKKRTEYV